MEKKEIAFCIISVGRPNSISGALLCQAKARKIFFIYKHDYKTYYKQWGNKFEYVIVDIPKEKRGVVEKRNFVLNWCYTNNIERMSLGDDDIGTINFIGLAGNYIIPTSLYPNDIVKLFNLCWDVIDKHFDKAIMWSTRVHKTGYNPVDVFKASYDKQNILRAFSIKSMACQLMNINTKMMKQANIKFEGARGTKQPLFEDITLSLRVKLKGYADIAFDMATHYIVESVHKLIGGEALYSSRIDAGANRSKYTIAAFPDFINLRRKRNGLHSVKIEGNRLYKTLAKMYPNKYIKKPIIDNFLLNKNLITNASSQLQYTNIKRLLRSLAIKCPPIGIRKKGYISSELKKKGLAGNKYYLTGDNWKNSNAIYRKPTQEELNKVRIIIDASDEIEFRLSMYNGLYSYKLPVYIALALLNIHENTKLGFKDLKDGGRKTGCGSELNLTAQRKQ